MTKSVVYISASIPADFEAHDQGDLVNELGVATAYNGDSFELLSITESSDKAKMSTMSAGMTKMLTGDYGLNEENHTQKQADLVNAMNWMQNPAENKFYIPVKIDDIDWFLPLFGRTLPGVTKDTLETYGDSGYYKVVLDFTNDGTTPKQGELNDLIAFKDYIETQSTDTKVIGEKFGPDMLTLYTFANEYIAAQPKPTPQPTAGTQPPTYTPGASDYTKDKPVFTDADDAVSELPNMFLAWLPETKALRDAMGADEFKRFITDDEKIGWSDYGYYSDSWFGTDDTTVVTMEELKELAGESTDLALQQHLDDDKEAGINQAAKNLLTYLRERCAWTGFTYTSEDRKEFQVEVLDEFNGNTTILITDQNGNRLTFRADITAATTETLYHDAEGHEIPVDTAESTDLVQMSDLVHYIIMLDDN